ncbi:unnamed protein product [Amoebophrya sp. A25]|nr:unnamed protein product [Amoebophrya sp. A25]|eukprot:GSA25T00007351001.1
MSAQVKDGTSNKTAASRSKSPLVNTRRAKSPGPGSPATSAKTTSSSTKPTSSSTSVVNKPKTTLKSKPSPTGKSGADSPRGGGESPIGKSGADSPRGGGASTSPAKGAKSSPPSTRAGGKETSSTAGKVVTSKTKVVVGGKTTTTSSSAGAISGAVVTTSGAVGQVGQGPSSSEPLSTESLMSRGSFSDVPLAESAGPRSLTPTGGGNDEDDNVVDELEEGDPDDGGAAGVRFVAGRQQLQGATSNTEQEESGLQRQVALQKRQIVLQQRQLAAMQQKQIKLKIQQRQSERQSRKTNRQLPFAARSPRTSSQQRQGASADNTAGSRAGVRRWMTREIVLPEKTKTDTKALFEKFDRPLSDDTETMDDSEDYSDGPDAEGDEFNRLTQLMREKGATASTFGRSVMYDFDRLAGTERKSSRRGLGQGGQSRSDVYDDPRFSRAPAREQEMDGEEDEEFSDLPLLEVSGHKRSDIGLGRTRSNILRSQGSEALRTFPAETEFTDSESDIMEPDVLRFTGFTFFSFVAALGGTEALAFNVNPVQRFRALCTLAYTDIMGLSKERVALMEYLPRMVAGRDWALAKDDYYGVHLPPYLAAGPYILARNTRMLAGIAGIVALLCWELVIPDDTYSLHLPAVVRNGPPVVRQSVGSIGEHVRSAVGVAQPSSVAAATSSGMVLTASACLKLSYSFGTFIASQYLLQRMLPSARGTVTGFSLVLLMLRAGTEILLLWGIQFGGALPVLPLTKGESARSEYDLRATSVSLFPWFRELLSETRRGAEAHYKNHHFVSSSGAVLYRPHGGHHETSHPSDAFYGVSLLGLCCLCWYRIAWMQSRLFPSSASVGMALLVGCGCFLIAILRALYPTELVHSVVLPYALTVAHCVHAALRFPCLLFAILDSAGVILWTLSALAYSFTADDWSGWQWHALPALFTVVWLKPVAALRDTLSATSAANSKLVYQDLVCGYLALSCYAIFYIFAYDRAGVSPYALLSPRAKFGLIWYAVLFMAVWTIWWTFAV